MKICVEPMQFIFMIKLHNFIYASVGLLIGLLNMLPSTAGHLLLENSMLLNENTTLVHPTLNLTQNASVVTEQDLDKEPWWCQCSAELEEVVGELECHCQGPKLLQVPQTLINITRLTIANAKFKVLKEAGLRKYSTTLRDITLYNLNEFYQIESRSFMNILHLRTIYISHAPMLQYITAETFRHISHSFKTLRIVHCGLREIPDMNLLTVGILLQLDFEGNQITEVTENSIHIETEQLILDNNLLTNIQRSAFNGSKIGKLSLKGNFRLRTIHELAFLGCFIQELDLSSTAIESLPTKGLDKLETLRIQNTQSLKQIPSVYNFKSLEHAWLTHSFHCCAFKFPQRHDPLRHSEQLRLIAKQKECVAKGLLSPEVTPPSSRRKRLVRWSRSHETQMENHGEFFEPSEVNGSVNAVTGVSMHYDANVESVMDVNDEFENGVFHKEPASVSHDTLEALCGNYTFTKVQNVKCHPQANALNPCEDVMGSNWLRSSVWIVVSLAVVGNTAVLVVLFSNRSELTVPKFLMCNLAFADFCMGSYLLLIASIDLHSMGEYFNFAFDWQYGWGCKTAGFLTVFAGHLSIFTLTIITVERWFAITHAIYLNKRLKHKAAIYIMICGWIYSILMATCPLFGISNYSSTSICLPMEAQDPWDYTYLITVLAINGGGFFIVLVCYAQIYFSLGVETRARTATNGEMTVAKKMALLVFTNFACWAPIAFFGLTALAGYPLIDVTKSKILLVFFYPINSCANPYLYAILTAQYRRDLFSLLSKFGICTKRAQHYKMNYSNPTHTIPLNLIPVRTSSGSNNYRRSISRNGTNNNNNGGQLLAMDNNEHQELNGKSDVHV